MTPEPSEGGAGWRLLVVLVCVIAIAVLGGYNIGRNPTPTPSPTPVATPWLWAVPSGDGQWCVVMGDRVAACFSKVEEVP